MKKQLPFSPEQMIALPAHPQDQTNSQGVFKFQRRPPCFTSVISEFTNMICW